MFGSTVYPQVSEYSEKRTSIRSSKGFSYLTPCPSLIHPWNRGTNLLQDFVMVTEFSELEGPKPLFVQPSEGIGHFDINAFAVKIMSVDHQPPKSIVCNNFTLMEDKQVLFSDIAEGVSAYVYHFLLYDLQARGYVRPFCMAYVSPDSKKLITFYKEIHKAFSKISSDLKMENLKLFALEMSHQLQDLEYSLNYLNQKSDDCSVITNDNTASGSDTPAVTVQSLQYLRQETLNILEALEEYKPELLNDYAVYKTKANVKYNPTCKDSSYADDGREDGPVALTVKTTINSDQLTDHHNVNHADVDDKSCNGLHINKNYKISSDISTNTVEHDKHTPNNLTSSHPFHRGRMKSKHKDPPIDEQYVVVNNVDRSFSCSDISSCVHLSKETSNKSESSSQSSESIVPCSSESDFSFASSNSFQHDNSSQEDSTSVILDHKSDRTGHLFLIDYSSNYKPKLYKPPSRKRFEFMLRKLELMCLNKYENWKQLELIRQYYSQDLAILKMHQWEKNLTEPTSSLLIFGGCVTSNFLHGMHRCYCEKERGTPKHQLISNQMEKLSIPEDQPVQKEVVSRVSSLPDRYHFSQGCTNATHPTSLSISSQPSEEWDIITSTSEGDHDISIETSYESTSLYSTCSEHSEEMLCALCQQPNKDASTHDGSIGSLDGSDESFHSTSSVQSFPCGNSKLSPSKKSFMLLADVINSKKHLLQAKNLMNFLSQYDNINNLVASLLSGRTVAVVGSSNSEEKVKDIVEALSLFVPGNFINHKRVVIPWLKRQLQLKDLTSFRLVGLLKRKNNTIPRSIMNYVSILDLEKRVLCAPIYEGKIVNSLLRQLQLFQNNPAAYLAYIHSYFQEISSTAFLYYHSFCMTSANPKASASYIGLDRLAREFRDTSQQFLKTCNIVQDDRKIIEFLASLILKQVLEEAQEKGAWIGNKEGSICSFHLSYKPSCTRKC